VAGLGERIPPGWLPLWNASSDGDYALYCPGDGYGVAPCVVTGREIDAAPFGMLARYYGA
jgi:hypothetical protein